jgi:hypothetical protein
LDNANHEYRQFQYYGANADQGLFYVYPRFLRKSLTHILHDRFINYGPGGPHGNLSLIESIHYYRKEDHVNPFDNMVNSSIGPSNCRRYNACGVASPYRHHMHFIIGKPHMYFENGQHKDEYDQLRKYQDLQEESAFARASPNSYLLWWDILMELEKRHGFNYSSLWAPFPHANTTDTTGKVT